MVNGICSGASECFVPILSSAIFEYDLQRIIYIRFWYNLSIFNVEWNGNRKLLDISCNLNYLSKLS